MQIVIISELFPAHIWILNEAYITSKCVAQWHLFSASSCLLLLWRSFLLHIDLLYSMQWQKWLVVDVIDRNKPSGAGQSVEVQQLWALMLDVHE